MIDLLPHVDHTKLSSYQPDQYDEDNVDYNCIADVPLDPQCVGVELLVKIQI